MKSPAPKDGQGALDNSIPSEGKSSRISVHNGEFVVLNQTSRGVYHGHVRTWDGLAREMKAALQEAGLVRLVNGKGKML